MKPNAHRKPFQIRKIYKHPTYFLKTLKTDANLLHSVKPCVIEM